MIDIRWLRQHEVVLSLLLLTLLVLLVRVPLLGQAPMMDELYHHFAAKSWLADGELRIADGTYTRAAPYTKLIAFAFSLFGERIEVLRMIGVIAACLTLIAIFAWTRSVAGAVAAWIAALFFCFWPDGIAVSVTNRFYAPHGLLFWLGAISVYLVVEQRGWWDRRWLTAIGVAAVLFLVMAIGLQETTLIGIGGLSMWLGFMIGWPWLMALDVRTRVLAIAAMIAVALVMLALLFTSSVGAALLDAFRWTPAWAEASRNQFWFYHAFLILYYPSLWSLTAVAVLVAMAYRPRPVAFCLCLFVPAFILHSLGGMKHLRYLYYVMPCLFVIWGVALAHLWERFRPFFLEVTDKTLDALVPNLPKRPLRIGLIGAVLIFTLFANGATIKTLAMLAGVTVPPMAKPPEWQVAKEQLEPWLEDAVLLTTSEMETLYAFDRYDILISNSRMTELRRDNDGHLGDEPAGEFSLDWRTGRPVVSEASSVELIMSCFPKGIVVSNVYRWRYGPQLDDEVADLIEAKAVPIDLPPSSMMTAYRWENEATASSPACAELAANYPAPPLSASGSDQPDPATTTEPSDQLLSMR